MSNIQQQITQTDYRFRNISTLIVKVTYRCNLDCLYCYENVSRKGEDMRLDTFCDLVERSLSSTTKDSVLYLFHGGEPSLLSNAWYETAILFAKERAKYYRKKVHFSMQTNLLGLNPSKVKLYQKHNIQLGVSLDGPIEIQDSMRGGEDKVFRNFKRIQKAGVKAGVLVTINQSNYQHFDKICDWLVKEANIRNFKANVVTPVGRGYDLPLMDAAQIFEAQKAVIDYIIATEGKTLLESNFMIDLNRLFAPIHKRKKTLCHEARCGAGSEVLGVTPFGDLLPCGRFQWDQEQYFLGSIDKIEEQKNIKIDFSTKLNHFHKLVPESWYDCKDCEARSICGFGCQAFIVRSKQKANVDCLPTKMRYAYYQTKLKELRIVYNNIQQKKKRKTSFRIKDKDGNYKTYTL
ncbi:MAG: radical SAM protein [Saprospiraceae bacterium]|nr:radical SAM protein [Saprospiraceae bacterium]